MTNTFTPHASRLALHPWQVVLVFLTAYCALILARNDGDPLAFAAIGTRFSELEAGGTEGYDGQFVYFIATRLLDAGPQLDVPAYRFQRILLPLLARLLGLGNDRWIAWSLVAINIGAQVGGAAVVERLLAGFGVSRWYALVYGLWAGLVHAVRLDLNEPLAFAFVVAALLTQRNGRVTLTALLFALASFAKEVTLVFAAAYLAWLLTTKQVRNAVVTLTLVGLPFVGWQLWLWRTFGAWGIGSGGALATAFEIIPFMGIVRIGVVDVRVLIAFLAFLLPLYVAPSVAGIWVSARQLLRGERTLWLWVLGANAALIPFAPFSTFREPWAMLRFGTGLVAAWLLYGAQRRSTAILRRTTYWMAALVFLIAE